MRDKATKLREVDPKIAASFHFAEAAGKKIRNTASQKRRTGNDDPMLTGGGKTCLTTRFIHLANTVYLRRQHGLVLWIIPNSQISNQTLAALSLTGSSPISPLPTAR